MSIFRRLVFELRLIRVSLIVHVVIAALLALVSAVACRMLFLMPWWVGAVLGIVIYGVVVLGIKNDDRID